MGDSKLISDGGRDIPPESPTGRQLGIEEWQLNLIKLIGSAHKTRVETKELMFGGRKMGGIKSPELPVIQADYLKTKQFVLKDLSVPVGYQLNLRVVQQYPTQQNKETPLFELEEFSDYYKKMEDDMAKVYGESYSGPYLDLEKVQVGTMAVVRFWPEDIEDFDGLEFLDEDLEVKPILKRVKIGEVVNREAQAYKVEFIDHNSYSVLDSSSEVFPMDKHFATLPPRVSKVELEGLGFYQDHGLVKRFMCYQSDEYLFDGGTITAEVQASGQVLIWNSRFPKEKFPYGINGFILKSVWEVMSYGPRLPPMGYEKKSGYVAYSNEDAYVWLHFATPIYSHFYAVFAEATEEKLGKFRGSVKSPERGIIYLAPHHHSDGTYYRAEVIKGAIQPETGKNDEDSEVEVRFIDYGDKAIVPVKSLVKAEDIHVLLPLFPKLCVKVHLENIQVFNHDQYLNKFQSSQEIAYGVFVVKGETASEPAEVILKNYLDEDQETYWVLNNEAVKRDVAERVDPDYDYLAVMENIRKERLPSSVKKALPPYLALGKVGTGRLEVGSEVNVSIFYDGKMPRGWFFIRAGHRNGSLKEMELGLGEIKKRMKNGKEYTVKEGQPGMGVLAISKRIDHVLVRGILVGLCHRKANVMEKKFQEENENEPGPNTTDENLIEAYWTIYFQDYGILENVNSCNIFHIPMKYLEIPAFGILSKHLSFLKEKDVQEWWHSLPWLATRNLENSHEDDKADSWGENWSENRLVKIIKLTNHDPFGETAVLEWMTDGDAIGNDGVKANQQIAEETPKTAVPVTSCAESDPCVVTDVKGTVQVAASAPATESQAVGGENPKFEIDKMNNGTSSVTWGAVHDYAAGHLEEIDEIVLPVREPLGEEFCVSSDSDSESD